MWWLRKSNIDWKRLCWFVGGFEVIWATMVRVVPAPYFEWVASILAAVGVAIAYFTRSGKWVDTRTEGGKP